MQWLIDTIMELVEAENYLKHSFVDRGSSTGWDFSIGDFTLDSSWRVLNVTPFVPIEAKAVLYRFQVRGTAINRKCYFRDATHAGNNTAFVYQCNVANIAQFAQPVISITGLRWLSYWGQTGSFNVFNLKVAGWWL